MTMIDKFRDEDGEGVRRFFLIAEVRFADRPADEHDWSNYFQDSEIVSLAKTWAESEFEYHEDNPEIRFYDVPEILRPDVLNIAGEKS